MKTCALALLLVLSVCRHALGASAPVPPSETVLSSATPPSIRIELKDGSELRAVLVEPWPQDFVRLTDATKKRTFVPFSKIGAIRDDQGGDRTKDVLLRRQIVGKAPSEPVAPAPEPARVITKTITSFAVGKDSILIASRVERTGSERITATRADGVRQDLPSYQVQWIRGLDGQMHTSNVIRDGKVVEENPLLIGYRVPRWKSSVLRGQPKPFRTVFPLIQGGFAGLVGWDPERSYRGGTLLLETGAMVNVTQKYALGATGFLSGDGVYTRYGMKARARVWLNRRFAFDLAPGILGADGNPRTEQSFPGFIGEAALSLSDLVAITGTVESFRETTYPREFFGPQQPYTETRTSWFLGLKFGGELAIPGMIIGVPVTRHPRASSFDPTP